MSLVITTPFHERHSTRRQQLRGDAGDDPDEPAGDGGGVVPGRFLYLASGCHVRVRHRAGWIEVNGGQLTRHRRRSAKRCTGAAGDDGGTALRVSAAGLINMEGASRRPRRYCSAYAARQAFARAVRSLRRLRARMPLQPECALRRTALTDPSLPQAGRGSVWGAARSQTPAFRHDCARPLRSRSAAPWVLRVHAALPQQRRPPPPQ